MDKFPPVLARTDRVSKALSDELVDPEHVLSRDAAQQLGVGPDNGVLLAGMVPRDSFPAAGDLCDWVIGPPTKTTVSLVKTYSDLETAGGLRTESSPLPMATTSSAGFMSGADKEALESLRSAVDALQGHVVRLDAHEFSFDVFSADPTDRADEEAELTAYVLSRLGGSTVPDNTSVRNLNGGHVFRYNLESPPTDSYWVDDGYDVVGVATTALLGLVRAGDGSPGTVTVDAEGDMSVSGWSGVELTSRRVSAFQPVPDNAHYPTEKLVADSLAGKEVVSNKIPSAVGVTALATDQQYPSAKAVHEALLPKEDASNKTVSITSSSSDVEYPSARAVYDLVAGTERVVNKSAVVSASSTDVEYPTAKAVYDATSGKQDAADRILSADGLDAGSTDAQYPSGKTTWEALQTREAVANKVAVITASSTDDEYPSAKATYDALQAATQSAMPVGALMHYYGTTAPPGWFVCDASYFSPAAYPLLYALLGTDRTPDLRGMFLRGLGGSAGALGVKQQDAGRNATGTFFADDSMLGRGGLSGQAGQVPTGSFYAGDEVIYADVSSYADANHAGRMKLDLSLSWGASHTADEFRPVNVAVLICIKHD